MPSQLHQGIQVKLRSQAVQPNINTAHKSLDRAKPIPPGTTKNIAAVKLVTTTESLAGRKESINWAVRISTAATEVDSAILQKWVSTTTQPPVCTINVFDDI